MTASSSSAPRARFLATAATLALFSGMGPAWAQSTTAPAPDAAAQPEPAASDIIVTGSLIRNRQAESASPLVTLSSDDLNKRGINTVTDALQTLSANNAGTVPQSWSSYGFATGASTPSLRGFNDAFTLTLFDGLRSAPYPLGDDGYRNFVDINTLSDSIVDRVDVLQDGASSIYGSDAVAGVINVMVKKQITGLHLNGSAGISQKGDAGERRVDGTYGFGKLSENGFNVYINGEYQENDPLYLRDRGYPFNTDDQSKICGTSTSGARVCGPNSIRNGIDWDGTFRGLQTTIVPFVRPYNATGTAAIAGSRYQVLNPTLGCNNLPSYTLNAAQLAANPTAPATVCQQDTANLYTNYNAHIQRLGGTIRGTVDLAPHVQAYAMFNYYRVRTDASINPEGYANNTANVGTENQVLVSPIFLPVYVCSAGRGVVDATGAHSTGCTAANGTLNPNNPFAALGEQARLSGQYDRPRSTSTEAQTFRIAGGISGSFGDGFSFDVEGTHSSVGLDVTARNYLRAQRLLDAIAQGTFNLVNLSLNTEAQREAVAPTSFVHSISRLTQFQGSIQKDVFRLPGGPFTAALGLGWRRESLNAPSPNPSNPANPVDRYYTLNGVSASGSRSVFSAFGEVNAPIVDALTLKASGRYDKYTLGYSTRGFDYFAPKLEAQFRPIRQFQLRGTYSKGFSVPSIAEATATTTGFLTTTIDCTRYTAFCAGHASNPAYYSGLQSYGVTSVANPDLKPQKSRSFTGGVVLQPTRQITLTADYWNTKISDYIVSLNTAALGQYYSNNGVVNIPGVQVKPGVPDEQNPNALPLAGTVVNPYVNAASLQGSGIDLTATLRLPLGGGLRLTSSATASYLDRLELTDATGVKQKWAGTLSPCNITSCSGAPRWRAVWANTIEWQDKASLTLTTYYTSGYTLESTDLGGIAGNCKGSIGASVVSYVDPASTPIRCSTRGVFDVDANVSFKVKDNFTFYINAINVLGLKPPYDPSAGYGLYRFNPAWADRNFVGRYFRVGAKVDF